MPSDQADLSPDNPRRAFALQSYGALGDGRSVAVVALNGAVQWWCVPNIDSAPLFDCLLDPVAGGYFALQPTEPFRATRRYRPDSNVLETTFATAGGTVRVTESMNSSLAGRLPWCELARRMEGVSGHVTMQARVVFGSRGNSATAWLQSTANGSVFHVGPVLGMVRTSPNMRRAEDDRSLLADVTLGAGDRAVVAMVAGEDEPLGVAPVERIDGRIDISDTAWRAWADDLGYDGPYREAVRRSALALKLLLFSPSGAIAAAATCALPERAGGPKNWDYRYAWVRDAAFTLTTFLSLGVVPESKAALTWLIHRLGETGAKVCYRVDGDPVPPARPCDMPGFADSRPVLNGNDAARQHQHGTYGDIFQAAGAFVAVGNVLDLHSQFVLSRLADECADRWRQKDAGLWELTEPQHYTMSKISCWQALSRAVELAEAGQLPGTAVPRWTRERDRIASWVNEHCWSETRQAYTFFAGTDRLDAALALAVRFGFNGRERLSRTLDAIGRELMDGPWVYRYSGAAAEEGAFLACTFWRVEALVGLGRDAEADELMRRALGGLPAGTGILTEMVEVHTGNLIGNLPQGLSHLALIQAAQALADRDGA